MKRGFDCVVAVIGILLTLPVWLLVAIAVKIDSPGPVFFRHRRVGRGFREFHVYKFRTMSSGASSGAPITFGGRLDSRITRVGGILRETKIDELPQLLNVVKGEMSLVGPRPEVAEYVELFRGDFEEILTVRPGITDFASLAYHDEGALLERSPDPAREYAQRILPAKIGLAKQYVRQGSFGVDVRLIGQTMLQVARSAGEKYRTHGRRIPA
jgi:lipopolysaccharide/colanic/teichoic acid biosynthesis glycosyltransferase